MNSICYFLWFLNYLKQHFKDIDTNIPFNYNDILLYMSDKIAKLVKETINDSLFLVDEAQKKTYDNIRIFPH